IVPGSTLIYGSNFCKVTFSPRFLSNRPNDAAVIPFPSDDTTPPVTKIYLVNLIPSFTYPYQYAVHIYFILVCNIIDASPLWGNASFIIIIIEYSSLSMLLENSIMCQGLSLQILKFFIYFSINIVIIVEIFIIFLVIFRHFFHMAFTRCSQRLFCRLINRIPSF